MAVRHKPHGVMAVLGPYNMPAHLPNSHIVPALIAGNTVVFKPSEKVLASGELLARCFNRAGISAAVIQCVFGGPEQGQELVRHEGVNGVLFTGSANSGVAIARKLAARPDKLLRLEMGGNNPIVMWDTPKIHRCRRADRTVGLRQRRTALHGGPPADHQGIDLRSDNGRGEEPCRPHHLRRAVRRAGSVNGADDRQFCR